MLKKRNITKKQSMIKGDKSNRKKKTECQQNESEEQSTSESNITTSECNRISDHQRVIEQEHRRPVQREETGRK